MSHEIGCPRSSEILFLRHDISHRPDIPVLPNTSAKQLRQIGIQVILGAVSRLLQNMARNKLALNISIRIASKTIVPSSTYEENQYLVALTGRKAALPSARYSCMSFVTTCESHSCAHRTISTTAASGIVCLVLRHHVVSTQCP